MITTAAAVKAAAAAAAITTTSSTSIATRKTTTLMTTRNMNSASTKTLVSRGNEVDTETETETATATATATATIKTARTTKTTTTITSDPGILCFHHCNVKVFCFKLPHICPQCKTALATHPHGDGSSAGGTTGDTGNRRKAKNITKLNKSNKSKTNNNSNNNNNNKNNDDEQQQHLANESNKHDNNANKDVVQNGITNSKDNNSDADADADSIDNDDDDDDEDEDDDDNNLNQNSFSSNIMTSRLLPFRLPYPFVRANQYPCAIVLRPTTGDFLNDYNNTTDLHIAVTTSTGCVAEFDRHGLRRHRTNSMSEWWQCLLVGDVPEPWYDYWDQILAEICQQPDKWTVSHYHEDKHNCYTFVLTFLQALTYDKLSEAATSKTRFCEKYIVPRTTTAGKYISLYRKLRDAGIYVHHTNHHKLRYGIQEKHQQQLHQLNSNKSNSLTATATTTRTATATAKATTTMSMTKNSLLTNKQQQKLKQQQQQQLSNHHNHHSIISRPHSTLCTIEE